MTKGRHQVSSGIPLGKNSYHWKLRISSPTSKRRCLEHLSFGAKKLKLYYLCVHLNPKDADCYNISLLYSRASIMSNGAAYSVVNLVPLLLAHSGSSLFSGKLVCLSLSLNFCRWKKATSKACCAMTNGRSFRQQHIPTCIAKM